MISGVAHISFTVGDLQRSLSFYRDLLGFTFKFEAERSGPVTEAVIGIPGVRIKMAMLTLDNLTLELIQYITPIGKKLDLKTNNVGCAHLAFFVKDIEKTYGRLLEKGVQFKSKPNEIKDGPLEGWKAVYLYDPDGITLELMQRP